jgi:hypothetical protein
MDDKIDAIAIGTTKTILKKEVTLEFLQWVHPTFGIATVDPKTPIILKALVWEEIK